MGHCPPVKAVDESLRPSRRSQPLTLRREVLVESPGSMGARTGYFTSRLFLSNVDPSLLQSSALSTREWEVAIKPVAGVHTDDLETRRGGVATHEATIRRIDGQPFQSGDLDRVQRAIVLLLSFCQGSLCGVLTRTSFDHEGQAISWDWPAISGYDWSPRMNWFDPLLAAELPGLLDALIRLDHKPAGKMVERVIRILISAQRSEVESRVLLTCSALENLGSRVSTKTSLTNAIGTVLKEVNLPREVPHGLPLLAESSPDLRTALNKVRNRIAHAPLQDQPWPDGDIVIEAWRIASELTELCVLHRLGYSGSYAHRRHLRGRVPGDVSPVPWIESVGRTGTSR